ncbi:MICOS complex subunit MIC26, partial [Tremellales sp. Uapishka_1]
MAAFLPRLLLQSSVVAASVYASSTAVSADTDARPLVRPGRDDSGDKLPIYPLAVNNAPVVLIETVSPLTPHIAKAREATTSVLVEARGYLQSGVGKWVGFERKVEGERAERADSDDMTDHASISPIGEVKTILSPEEPLTPGLLYVLISGLTGSVLTRTRALPIRFLTPPLFTLLAMPYFLPKTSSNIRSYLSQVEDRHFPEFAAQHDHVVQTGAAHWGMLEDRIRGVGEEAKGWSREAVQGVEKYSGLRVGDVVRKVEEKKEEKVERDRVGAVETVGYVVEQKPVAQLVREVPASAAAPAVKEKRLV